MVADSELHQFKKKLKIENNNNNKSGPEQHFSDVFIL